MCESSLKSSKNSIDDNLDETQTRQNDSSRMNGNGVTSGGSIDDLSSVSRERRAEIRFNRAKHIGSLEPGDCGSSPLMKPEWYNEDLFKAAQKLAKERFCSLFFGHLCGLCMLVHIPSILTTLMSTNNSKTVADAFTRYLGTLTHVKAWYEGDIWNISDPAYKSILAVRRMHERVANKMNTSKVRGQDVLFISQYDMFLTQFGFIGMLILHPKECGLPENGHQEQLKCLIHFWRCIGYMLGIEDRFNMCHDEADTDGIRCLCATIMDREFRPLISKYSSEESRVMSRSILEAIKAFIPPLSVAGFTKYLYKMNTIESPVKVTGIQKAGYHGINLTLKHILPQARLSFIFDRLLRRAIRKAHKKQETIKQRLTSKDIVLETNLTTDV